MCKMLRRSKVSEQKAKWAIEQYNIWSESAYIDSMCFDTQQSIEFLLKGILLSYGVDFKKVHEIDHLVDLVKENVPIEFSRLKELDTLATTITYWEEGSRYDSGIRTTVNTVRRCLNIYDSIIKEFLEEQEQMQTISNEKTVDEMENSSEDEEDIDL